MGYKAYSDSYLMSLTKAEIIELLRVAEHNFFATEEALNNSAKAGMEIAEKYDEAKRFLKMAVEDFVRIDEVKLLPENTIRPMLEYTNIIDIIRHKWRYADEAEKLIES